MHKSALILTLDFPPMGGGMARFCYDLGVALSRSGRQVSVITLQTPGSQSRDLACFEKVIRIPFPRPPWHFSFYGTSCLIFLLAGWRECIRNRPQVIVSNSWSIAGVAACLLAMTQHIPYILFAHGLDVAQHMRPHMSWLMRRVFSRAHLICANSRYTQNLIEANTGICASALISPAVDLERFVAPVGANPYALDGKKIILTVARLTPSKNHQTVIRAVALLLDRHPQLVYRIVGSGPLEGELKRLAAELGVQEKVIFTGEVDDRELSLYYYACDVFVLLSQEIPQQGAVEGFGVVFLEAAACAKPVLASRSGGIPDAVIDGHTGILIDGKDTRQVAEKLDYLLSNPQAAAKLGAAGRKRVEEEFTVDDLAGKLEQLIGEVTGGHS